MAHTQDRHHCKMQTFQRRKFMKITNFPMKILSKFTESKSLNHNSPIIIQISEWMTQVKIDFSSAGKFFPIFLLHHTHNMNQKKIYWNFYLQEKMIFPTYHERTHKEVNEKSVFDRRHLQTQKRGFFRDKCACAIHIYGFSLFNFPTRIWDAYI